MLSAKDNISIDTGFDSMCYGSAENSSVNGISVQGEVNLWCAVLNQAIEDIHDKNESAGAIRWLLRDKKDFVTVCSLAGVSPIVVRERVKGKVLGIRE